MAGNAANFPATANALGRIIQTTDGQYTETYTIPAAPGPYIHQLGANLSPALPAGWQDVPLGAFPILPPGAVTIGAPGGYNTPGGFLVPGSVYKVALTNVTDYGETVVGSITTYTLGATFTAANYVLPSVSQGTADAPIRKRRLYRSTAGSSTLLLLAEISDLSQTFYIDGTADAFLTVAPPSVNGSGSIGTVVVSGGGHAGGYWSEVAPGTALVGGQYIVDYSTGTTGGRITHAAADANLASVQAVFTAGTLATALVVNNVIQAIQDAAAKMVNDEATLASTTTTANAAIPLSQKGVASGVVAATAQGLVSGSLGGTAPSVSAGSGLPAGATVSLVAGSTNRRGTITLAIAATAISANAQALTFSFGGGALPSVPMVIITPAYSSATSVPGPYVVGKTASGFAINVTGAYSSYTITIDYVCEL